MAKRNPNGEGTIYRRKDGRYEGAGYVLMPDGTRKRRRVYGNTWEEARKKLTEMLANSDKGIPAVDTTETLGIYLTYWLEHVAAHKVRASTVYSYSKCVTAYIVPRLGKKKLAQLSAKDVRLFLDWARQACQCCAQGRDAARPTNERRCCVAVPKRCCERRLSPRMVQYLHAVIRNALQHAVREELVQRNVAKLVQVQTPRYRVGRGLSAAEAKALLADVDDDRLGAAYVLALYLGLRRGELLGIHWSDVDLDGGSLEIRTALQRINGNLTLTAPKTRRSERPVPLPSVCVDALRRRRAFQEAERSAAGDDWQKTGLVFTTRRGTPIEPRNLNRHFYPIRERLGLNVRFHDLRHTCVTLLLGLGVPPHVVRDIVGHSALEVTMNIYAHADLTEKRAALDRLGTLLSGE
ncbi:tyrosine-type recombinase/integrase [Streptomyces sp. NPDC057746]|uniref:tyrosine-type recombinase/integrase n=1 Tax=Streptomyces sp. NPDC057746 TaxID=3346237 RepID=UPI003694B1B0